MLFATPIWLFALAAIGIPIVIHLWNIRPGKTVKVGSISLFINSSPASSRSFKLMDILLLLLRCLLLILIALVLAVPLWQRRAISSATKGWILIPANNLKETYHKFRPRIDPLTRAGYEFHLFAPNFPKQDLDELKKNETVADTAKDTLNYWRVVDRLADQISPSTKVELFTPNTLRHFKGNRPGIAQTINWHTYTLTDSINIWPTHAWLMANGGVRVQQGTSTPTGTTYRYIDLKNGGQNSPGYSVNINKGLAFVVFKDTKIPVDTAVERIAIFTDRTDGGANYVKAALVAGTQLTGHNIAVKIYQQSDIIPSGQSWIFWLSQKPVSRSVITKARNIFVYAQGKTINLNSSIINEEYPGGKVQYQIALYKTIAKPNIGDAVWTDGFGDPVLTKEQANSSVIYHFYNRFDPAWSDLVWSDEFPEWLLMLTQASHSTAAYDNRALSDEQIKPRPISGTDKIKGPRTGDIDLAQYLWITLMIVFFAERWLATRNKTALVNG